MGSSKSSEWHSCFHLNLSITAIGYLLSAILFFSGRALFLQQLKRLQQLSSHCHWWSQNFKRSRRCFLNACESSFEVTRERNEANRGILLLGLLFNFWIVEKSLQRGIVIYHHHNTWWQQARNMSGFYLLAINQWTMNSTSCCRSDMRGMIIFLEIISWDLFTWNYLMCHKVLFIRVV